MKRTFRSLGRTAKTNAVTSAIIPNASTTHIGKPPSLNNLTMPG